MNEKTIKKVLKAKHAQWVSSIKDETVRKIAESNSIITGGSIVSLLSNEPVKDYDIYLRTKDATKAVAEYYCKQFNDLNPDHKNKLGIPIKAYVLDCDDKEQIDAEMKECGHTSELLPGHLTNISPGRIKVVIRSDGVAAEKPEATDEPFEDVFDVMEEADQLPDSALEGQGDGKPPYRPVFLSSNAITLSGKIQIVVRFYGEPEEIHKNYDFIHCTNYWTSWDNHLELRAEALKAIITKELRYVGSKYPICSIIRTRKFLKRGWNINAGQYLKMCFQVAELDLNDLATLEDQLVGVDSQYFMMLIAAMRSQKEKNIDLTNDYITTIIDKIF